MLKHYVYVYGLAPIARLLNDLPNDLLLKCGKSNGNY